MLLNSAQWNHSTSCVYLIISMRWHYSFTIILLLSLYRYVCCMLHNEITEQNNEIIDYQAPVSTRKAYCSVCGYLQQEHLCMNISNIKPSAFDTYWVIFLKMLIGWKLFNSNWNDSINKKSVQFYYTGRYLSHAVHFSALAGGVGVVNALFLLFIVQWTFVYWSLTRRVL